MPASLFHCIYTSVQAHSLTDEEIARLVKHSQEHNASHGLTGVLLHVGNTFFQVLEGAPEVIEVLYAKILNDPRHHHITRIIFEPIARRYFGDSNMSLATLSPQALTKLLDEHDVAGTETLLAGLDEGRAKRLLRAFSDGRWRSQAESAAVEPKLGAVSA